MRMKMNDFDELDDDELEEIDIDFEKDLIIVFHPNGEFSIVMPEDETLTLQQKENLENTVLIAEPSFMLRFTLFMEKLFHHIVNYFK